MFLYFEVRQYKQLFINDPFSLPLLDFLDMLDASKVSMPHLNRLSYESIGYIYVVNVSHFSQRVKAIKEELRVLIFFKCLPRDDIVLCISLSEASSGTILHEISAILGLYTLLISASNYITLFINVIQLVFIHLFQDDQIISRYLHLICS